MPPKRRRAEAAGADGLTKRRKPTPTLLERITALPQELIDIIYSDFLASLEEDAIPYYGGIDVDSSYQTPLVLRFNSALRKKYREGYYTNTTFVLPDFATYQKWVASVSEHVEVLGVESKRWECAKCQSPHCGYEDQFDGKWRCRRHIQRWKRGNVTVWWDEVRLA